ncbi:MAG: rod shape-determining protein MreD [Gemmatimonadales bacterium]
MSPSRRGDGRIYVAFLLLLALHFYARPRIWDGRAAPDFLALGLILFSIRTRPGVAALVGFLVGLLTDTLTPAKFGANAIAHAVLGYASAWGRAVFFADNLLVNAGLFAGGVWVRNALVLLLSGTPMDQFGPMLGIWAPLQAITTALAGVVLLVLLRDWFAIRLEA